MIKVYGIHGSPYVRKVLITLEKKTIPYEMVRQMPYSGDPEYLKINPLGKVPTIVDGDLTLGDSKVICQYLEESHPDPNMYPRKPKDWAMALWYEDLAGGRVTELATGIFFQRFMRPMVFQQDPDEELIARIVDQDLPPMLDYLEGQVPENGFLFGNFMVADLSIVSPFINAAYAGYEVDADRWPKMVALIERVKAQPEVAAILEQEVSSLGLA